MTDSAAIALLIYVWIGLGLLIFVDRPSIVVAMVFLFCWPVVVVMWVVLGWRER